MVLSLGTAAFASSEAASAETSAPASASAAAPAAAAGGDAWGEYSMENNGYGYLTANFPSTYPADYVIPEGEQVVSEKIDAIMFNGEAEVSYNPLTDAEKQEMYTAFQADPVEWSGIARMGIPAVYEGESIYAPDVFTSFDTEAIEAELAEIALIARSEGFTALRITGLEEFPEAMAEAVGDLYVKAMSENGVIALFESGYGSGDASAESADIDTELRNLFMAMGEAGYLQYVQVSREGAAAMDQTPPPAIEPEAIEYTKPLEAGDSGIILPESAKAGESFEIVAMGPVDVMSAMLRDEKGDNLPIDDMLKENLGDSLRFTFTVTFDAPTSEPIYLYFMTTDGWEEAPAASANLTVD